LCLEIWLQCRLSCQNRLRASDHERQICLYVLYTFFLSTMTSLPFYMLRAFEIIVDYSLSHAVNSVTFSGYLFAQLLIGGASFKPILCLILFCPLSRSLFTQNLCTCSISCCPPNIFIEKQNHIFEGSQQVKPELSVIPCNAKTSLIIMNENSRRISLPQSSSQCCSSLSEHLQSSITTIKQQTISIEFVSKQQPITSI
ncbi:unnamed protein product, partial [Didymodactylos carnosus]